MTNRLRHRSARRSPPPTRRPDDSGLSRRASLNTAAAGLDYAALTAVEFVINPVLVAGLGIYLYGAWRVLWKLTGYLWATSGRSAPALQWAIAARQHSTDYEEKRRYVASAVLVWIMFLPLLVVVGGLAVWFAPDFLRAPPSYVTSVRLATAVLVADSIALTLLSIPRAVLQGENLGYKRMGLSALLILAGGGLTALAVRMDMGIAGVAAAHLATTLLTAALFWKVARTHVPWLGVARPGRRTVRWFLGLSWWFTVWKFVSELMTAGDVLVLAMFAPIELVTVYTLMRFVPDAVTGLLAKPLQGAAPGLGGIIGSGDLAKATRVRNELLSFTWLVAAVTGTTVLLWNESFVSLWVGRRFYSGSLDTLLIVTMALQFVLIRNDASVIDLTLNVRSKVLLGAASAVLAAVLAAVLVGGFEEEITGLCLGFIAGRAILTAGYPWLVGRAIGQPLSIQLRGVARPAAATAALFATGLTVAPRLGADHWVELILGAGITAVLVTVAAVLGGLGREQRARLFGRIRGAARKTGRNRTR